MALRAVALILCAASVGCAPAAPTIDGNGCVLGTGSASFVDIQPRDEVGILLGSQGLYYIPGSVLVRSVDHRNVSLRFSVFAGAALVNAVTYVVDLQALDPNSLPGTSTAVCGSPAARFDATADVDGGAARPPFCLPGGLDQWGETLGQFVLLRNELYPSLLGATLRMRVDGTDGSGAHAFSDEHTFVAKAGMR